MGLSEQDRARVKTPAGLDIGARTPPEIAVSVFAELIQRRSQGQAAAAAANTPAGADTLPTEVAPGPVEVGLTTRERAEAESAATVIDPVCGMTVVPVEATPSFEHEGVTYWFCCPGCRRAFSKAPEEYLPA
jgi:xanthine dehydrogenase accessory factor